MHMKKSRYLLLLMFSSITGCDFGDINVDPTRNSDAGMNEMLPVAIVQTARNIGSIGGRVTGTVIQHWTGTIAQPQSYSSYLIDEQTLSSFWETGLYAGAMKDCYLIIEKAREQGQPYYEGIAKVLMAHNLAIATSYWGDVPYREALQETASLKSVYDPQELVYESIQELLEDAIFLFETDPVVGRPSSDDLIFRGDPDGWRATAYALRARYTMHLTRRNPEAANQALSLIDSAFTSMEQQPAFYFGTIDNESNPIALFGKERPNQMEVGKFLVDLMINKNDPRRFRYWLLENGAYLYYKNLNTDLVWAQKSSPLSLISYTELLFLKAEALLLAGQDGPAAQTYTLALLQNMTELGVTASEYNPYLASNAGFGGLSTFEERLERVMTQKYIALYGQNPNETWVDYRRTGYPLLEVPENVTSSFNPSLVIPRRYLYPIGERTTNAENYEAAIQRQGGHLMDVDMWAFKP